MRGLARQATRWGGKDPSCQFPAQLAHQFYRTSGSDRRILGGHRTFTLLLPYPERKIAYLCMFGEPNISVFELPNGKLTALGGQSAKAGRSVRLLGFSRSVNASETYGVWCRVFSGILRFSRLSQVDASGKLTAVKISNRARTEHRVFSRALDERS